MRLPAAASSFEAVAAPAKTAPVAASAEIAAAMSFRAAVAATIKIAFVAESVAFARVVGSGARPMPRSSPLIAAISLADISITAVPPAETEIVAPVEKWQTEEMAIVLATISICIISITIYIFAAVGVTAIAPAAPVVLRVEIVRGSVFLARVVGALVLVPAVIFRALPCVLGACARSAQENDDKRCGESFHVVPLSAARRARPAGSVAVSASAIAISAISVSPAITAMAKGAMSVWTPAIVTATIPG